jgi:hypothetical protein
MDKIQDRAKASIRGWTAAYPHAALNDEGCMRGSEWRNG